MTKTSLTARPLDMHCLIVHVCIPIRTPNIHCGYSSPLPCGSNSYNRRCQCAQSVKRYLRRGLFISFVATGYESGLDLLSLAIHGNRFLQEQSAMNYSGHLFLEKIVEIDSTGQAFILPSW